MASPIMDGFVLLLLSIIVPLHLFSLRSHFTRKINGGRSGIVLSVLLLASVPVLLSLIFAVSDHKASSSQLEEMKLKIYQLESFLEDNIEALNSKTIRVEENNKLIKGMEQKIQYLQDAQRNIKASPSGYSKERVDALEEEVRLLWEGSRKNNFNIHVLESKAYEVEEKTKTIASDVEKIHTKERNGLESERLSDLVYVNYNARFKDCREDKSRDPLSIKNINDMREWLKEPDPETKEVSLDSGATSIFEPRKSSRTVDVSTTQRVESDAQLLEHEDVTKEKDDVNKEVIRDWELDDDYDYNYDYDYDDDGEDYMNYF